VVVRPGPGLAVVALPSACWPGGCPGRGPAPPCRRARVRRLTSVPDPGGPLPVSGSTARPGRYLIASSTAAGVAGTGAAPAQAEGPAGPPHRRGPPDPPAAPAGRAASAATPPPARPHPAPTLRARGWWAQAPRWSRPGKSRATRPQREPGPARSTWARPNPPRTRPGTGRRASTNRPGRSPICHRMTPRPPRPSPAAPRTPTRPLRLRRRGGRD
jgi:hypothetical protein